MDNRSCAVVSANGHLSLGILGRRLHPVEPYSEVASVSWSPNGQMLAVGIGQQVRVYDVRLAAEQFSVDIEVQVNTTYLYSCTNMLCITCHV